MYFYYRRFLTQVHQRLRPRNYLEIGVRNGGSLALSRCRSVAIDPAYSITAELNAPVSLFRTSSDEYFARADPLQPTDGQPFDLTFIDGLHLFEFALRDFINAERHSSNRGVIIFDDVLPRTVDEAARVRHTHAWTGDVYSVLGVIAKYRPELSVITIGTQPTGLLMITGLDPTSTVLTDHYHEILREFRHADPQPVPEHLLDRLAIAPPQKVLDSGLLELLGNADPATSSADLRQQIADVVSANVGRAYAPGEPVGATFEG
ncbi:class I SAM-dependent methyltransferase [Microlunatus sp. Gsoil 973]|jgi:hypothetical protein|uniref:class I SAM-dependent methyltransferase n=1 Tax=Microlunatus sp. Gsoil 973 TaxID=2672569 RepID=UPI0012B4C297|nr:class I SAM-dependent methyltransferase [Microlunatus sp. Gsoil 973]QGN32944.1 class I SAM-dependent methyltransferase [Microlunatus sp. Gsoil 973]